MARFLLVVVVIAAILFGVGLYLDWFHIGVNREKINSDVERARNMGEQAKEAGKAVADTQTAKGRVERIDPVDNHFVVQTDDKKDVTCYTDAGTKVKRNDKEVGVSALKAGENVTVVYHAKDGKNYANRITINQE